MILRCPHCAAPLAGDRCDACQDDKPASNATWMPDPIELVEHPEYFDQEAARRRSRSRR